MNSQESLVQIEALEAALAEEQRLREQLELQLNDQRGKGARVKADLETLQSDIWSTGEVRQALGAVGKTGSKFVSHMDHRLRATLNGLLRMLELLLACEPEKEVQEYAEGAAHSGKELLRMLDAILNYCQMDAGHMGLGRESVQVEDFLEQLCLPFQDLAVERGVSLEPLCANTVPARLELGGPHLTRAISHLIENAVQHTLEGSIRIQVNVKGENPDSEVAISIADTGVGITPEDLARIRGALEHGYEEDCENVGLGLASVHLLSGLLGGDFSLKSQVGEGTVATLRFPLQTSSVEAPNPDSGPRRRSLSRVARVLVVEDNDVNQKVAVGFLGMAGCEAATALDGIEALERLSEGEFDLVLMDCMMPKLDGYGATQKIRAGAAGEHMVSIPIIALTADDSTEARQQCLRVGMDDYMSKPVRMDRLHAMLRIWLPPEIRPSAS